MSKGGAADYSYLHSLTTIQYGKPVLDVKDDGIYSLLYDQLGRDNGHIEADHWNISENDLGIDLWYNDYGTVFLVFYDTSNPASYGALPKYYSDETISFSYIEGWDASIPNLFSSELKMGFTRRRDTRSTIQYIRMDIWKSLEDTWTPYGFTREDADATLLGESFVKLLMEPLELKNLRKKI